MIAMNRKMHMHTCKVRKLIESNTQTNSAPSSYRLNDSGQLVSNNNNNNNNSGAVHMEDYILLGDSCTYCYKPFKDFKSEFNKRVHVKCCKIKRETFDHRPAGAAGGAGVGLGSSYNYGGNSSGGAPHTADGSIETCVFCFKPLVNLNEFNKRMHVDHCKIRKSIENSSSSSSSANTSSTSSSLSDPNTTATPSRGSRAKGSGTHRPNTGDGDMNGMGSECIFCSKSFLNLSEFNKRLHVDYCKIKKRKLGLLNNSRNNSNSAQAVAASAVDNNNNNSSNSISNLMKKEIGAISCLFCARSLLTLSEFNKNVHIETCNAKQLKKAMSMHKRQQSSSNSIAKKNATSTSNSNSSASSSSPYAAAAVAVAAAASRAKSANMINNNNNMHINPQAGNNNNNNTHSDQIKNTLMQLYAFHFYCD